MKPHRILPILLSLLLALPAAAKGLEADPQSPWEKEGDAFRIEHDGSRVVALKGSAEVEAETYYQIRWRMKASIDDPRPSASILVGVGEFGNSQNAYVVADGWNEYSFFFYSGSASRIDYALQTAPSSAKRLEVRGLSLEKIPAGRFADNLVPDGLFLAALKFPVLFQPIKENTNLAARLVPAPDFLAGEQCIRLSLDNPGSKPSAMESAYLPMIPGKSFRFTFWARADVDVVLNNFLNGWSMYRHSGGHWYKGTPFKIGPDWNEYSYVVDIPGDLAVYPDLAGRMLKINFSAKKRDEKGSIWISGIRFALAEEKK
ncbi:MAG: hypothetical protein J0L75_09545 [Spirochaetes bacterium]|nr:hypothetical protein [Spirochaetota bacterium]